MKYTLYNFKTNKYELFDSFPEQFDLSPYSIEDYIPQDKVIQKLFRVYINIGCSNKEAMMLVLKHVAEKIETH